MSKLWSRKHAQCNPFTKVIDQCPKIILSNRDWGTEVIYSHDI